jgi:drug/metabolite transporter (DMT)-like permease
MPLALLGLLLVLAAPVIYFFTLSIPFQHRTGLIAFIVMGLGCILAIVAGVKDRRLRVRVLAGFNVCLTLFALAFFFNPNMPKQTGSAHVGSPAPEFTLADHTGQPVSLSEVHRTGPVLLVFYRGHW